MYLGRCMGNVRRLTAKGPRHTAPSKSPYMFVSVVSHKCKRGRAATSLGGLQAPRTILFTCLFVNTPTNVSTFFTAPAAANPSSYIRKRTTQVLDASSAPRLTRSTAHHSTPQRSVVLKRIFIARGPWPGRSPHGTSSGTPRSVSRCCQRRKHHRRPSRRARGLGPRRGLRYICHLLKACAYYYSR